MISLLKSVFLLRGVMPVNILRKKMGAGKADQNDTKISSNLTSGKWNEFWKNTVSRF